MIGIGLKNRNNRIPVIWNDGFTPVLPDNRIVAEQHLQCLMNIFHRSPNYEETCRRAMQKNFDGRYTYRFKPEELEAGIKYYLPGVPKAPGSSELRLVFDAAAKHN